MIKSIEKNFILFFTYSFLGWFLESVGGIIDSKCKKDLKRNQNFAQDF